jgi:hypothetical protein
MEMYSQVGSASKLGLVGSSAVPALPWLPQAFLPFLLRPFLPSLPHGVPAVVPAVVPAAPELSFRLALVASSCSSQYAGTSAGESSAGTWVLAELIVLARAPPETQVSSSAACRRPVAVRPQSPAPVCIRCC